MILYYDVTCNFIMILPEELPKFLSVCFLTAHQVVVGYPGVPTVYLNCANLLSEVCFDPGDRAGSNAPEGWLVFGGGLNKYIIG